MAKAFQEKKIAIKDLALWDENARFPDKYFKKSQEELVNYFLAKKEFKLVKLAEEIVSDFDLPQQEKIIVYKNDGDNTVLEGNRRLAVYKLLSNPTLISDSVLKRKFLSFNEKIRINDSFFLECLVTEDVDQGIRFIERKHLKSNNEVSWNDNERAHHKARRGKANQGERFKVALTKTLKDARLPEKIVEDVLGPGYVTSFWRMLESSAAARKFGLTLSDSGTLDFKEKKFPMVLKVIVADILSNGTFNGKVYSRLTVEEIGDYLDSITEQEQGEIEDKIEDQITVSKNVLGEEVVSIIKKTSKRSNPRSTSRNYLIPKTCILGIGETRINNIYYELKNNLLIDGSNKAVPNAVGVLFRVFLELSLDSYLDKRGRLPSKKESTIEIKIERVTRDLQEKGLASEAELKNIRRVSSSPSARDILHIDRFHEYVHSMRSEPDSMSLKTKWDEIQEFVEILWKNMIPEKQKK